MVQSKLSQRRLVTRYLLLYCLFGVIVGVQLTAGTWVAEVFHYWPTSGGHFLMAFTMAGLILGEICGARITGWYSSSKAVLFAAAAFGASGLASLIAVSLWSPAVVASLNFKLLTAATFAFGIGLGTQHSSLDAWFSVSTRLTSERSPTDSEMGWGYTTYTLGFFLGQVLFFPLLYNLGWSTLIAEIVNNKPQALKIDISSAPYMLVLGAAVLIFVFRPYTCRERSVETPAEIDNGTSHSVAGIFRRGGIAFLTMLVVGSCVSFAIFHIDTFAGAELLPGLTVEEKTVGLGILCFVTFAMVGLFSWKLEADKRFRTLSPAARSGVLAFNLLWTILLLGLILYLRVLLGSFGVAVVLGIASGFVNTLPQVVKWAILDCARIEDKAKASAILGISKRVPNMVFSLAVIQFSADWLKQSDFAYKLLIGANVIAITALAIYYSRVRRYDLRIVYPSDKALSIDNVLATTVSDVPNTTLEALQHMPSTNGKARVTIAVYSTSKDYVRQLVRTLRKNRTVRRVVIRRSR